MIENYQNLEKVKFFSLEQYVKNIKLKPEVLEHLQETSNQFDHYFRYLMKYDSYAAVYYLIDYFNKEYMNSQAIENNYVKNSIMLDEDVFFDKLSISHNRIMQLHNFVSKDDPTIEPTNEYRNKPVRVSKMTNQGEYIFWHAPESKDVKPFMNDFIKVYKSSGTPLIEENPFLKSALVHLIFVRIHPFLDGNGRTARLIHNIKFTDSVNKIYGMKLKIAPLNLSESIRINKITYANRIDSIYFDLKHDTNDEINKWFDFILNMADEQLYFQINQIKEKENSLININYMKDTDNSSMKQEISKMKIKKIDF